MAILSGKRLGPYEIVSLLGAGGMGEVYKASDTRLDRIVAIKVLPAHLADDPGRRERFEREAKTIASLNHPNICTLYDIGHQDGIDFLVMEYLEGETLATRLLKGPLPLDQVLRHAAEISDALARAHRKGITHRDIKPGNIMLTKSGATLLDFGLAKLRQEATPVAAPLSQLPTLSHNPTVQGAIIGTLQYMAPEQVEGKIDEIDSRTDIFTFGAMVYEMATGKKAFEGASNASLMAKILEHDPPPISALQPMTPPALDRVVKTCLAKNPDERCQSAKDLTDQLKWIAEGGSQVGAVTTAPESRIGLAPRWALISGLACLAAVIAGFTAWNLKPAPRQASPPLARISIALPLGEQLMAYEGDAPVALSPDGTRLVYVVRQAGSPQLYMRQIDELDFTPIPGTEGGTGPFFSPDSQWIGFFSVGERKLKKVFVGGGAPQNICDIAALAEASWGPDDKIIFAQTAAGGLYRVSAAGGKPEVLTTPDSAKGETTHAWPDILPGGKAILFSIGHSNEGPDEASIVLQALDTGERKVLVQGGFRPRYVPSGHLVYLRAGTLMAVPFDLAKLGVTGPAVPIETGIRANGATAAPFSFSNLGWLAYVPTSVAPNLLVWVDRKGAAQPLAAPSRNYFFPRLSSDGSKIAVAIATPTKQDIWIYEVTRNTLTRFTTEGENEWPVWTPDGKRVTFTSNQGGHQNLYWKPVDGSGPEERLTTSNNNQSARSWSSDGQLLVFSDGDGISVLSNQPGRPTTNVQVPVGAGWARISPDGRWLAYVVKEGARSEVYVQPFPAPGGRTQISTDGGTEPVWNPNGRELFYRQADKMMAVDIATQPALIAQKPRMLFESADLLRVSTTPNYDVSRDGQRFLMVQASKQQSMPQLNVVVNWFEELKRRAPAVKE
jgi:eukaryotic-like serine/threonine-protein kinase